jgi:hypothetical protein
MREKLMTIFNAFLFAMVAAFTLVNLALLVATVFWAMGGLARFTHVQRAPSAGHKALLRRCV